MSAPISLSDHLLVSAASQLEADEPSGASAVVLQVSQTGCLLPTSPVDDSFTLRVSSLCLPGPPPSDSDTYRPLLTGTEDFLPPVDDLFPLAHSTDVAAPVAPKPARLADPTDRSLLSIKIPLAQLPTAGNRVTPPELATPDAAVSAPPLLVRARGVLPPSVRRTFVRQLSAVARTVTLAASEFVRPRRAGRTRLPATPAVRATDDTLKSLRESLLELVNRQAIAATRKVAGARQGVIRLYSALVLDGRLGDEIAVLRRISEMPFIWTWPDSSNRARRVFAAAGGLEARCIADECDSDFLPQRELDLRNHVMACHPDLWKRFLLLDGTLDRVRLMNECCAAADAVLARSPSSPVSAAQLACWKKVRCQAQESANAIAWARTPEAVPYVDRVLAERAGAGAPADFSREVARIALYDARRVRAGTAAPPCASDAAGVPIL